MTDKVENRLRGRFRHKLPRKQSFRARPILLIIGSVDGNGGMADVDSITAIYGVISNG